MSERKRKRNPSDEQQFVDACVAHWLQTGEQQADVTTIAKHMGCSTSKVYGIIDGAHGCPDGVHPDKVRHGWVYSPSRRHLRAMVLELRRERDEAQNGYNDHAAECGRQEAEIQQLRARIAELEKG